MYKRKIKLGWVLIGFMLGAAVSLLAGQLPPPPGPAEDVQKLKEGAPKVFIDCVFCDIDYIRTEITFVNYVRDRKEADVHVLVTIQDTGASGREYTLAFIGQNGWAGVDNSLKFVSNKTQTDDEIRKGLAQVLKMGLVGYAARTPIKERLTVSFLDRVDPGMVRDRWDFWVFSFSLNGMQFGEKSQSRTMLYGNVSANRVTPASKLRLGLSGDYSKSRFTYDGMDIVSESDSATFDGLYVKSLGGHWSAGIFLTVDSSTYRNIGLSVNPSPAVEYNVFPYAESTRRQLRFLYRLNVKRVRYREETIYDKLEETLFGQSLEATLEVKEPWGSAEASIEGSHYFHDLNMNRLELSGEVSLRLIKGLSLTMSASYERVRDQMGLPKGDLKLEEVLLQRRELATDYNYYLSLGLSYTFGSIYSNVVNPRFGSNGSMGGYGFFFH
ncbi:MAG: hypothetical protein JW843_12870 [Candidatus Aminicenantes bacterium]|nr:hypothetical protein [Candidatus Aminicenantes bacterium]